MRKRIISALLAVILLFSAISAVSAAKYDRTIGAYNYLKELAKTGTLRMDWYEFVIHLAPHTKFTLSCHEDRIGFVIEETSSEDMQYHRIHTLSLRNGYWHYERNSVQGYYLREGSDMSSGLIGDYIFQHSDFSGTAGLPFELGYTGTPERKQQARMEATLGVSDLLAIADGLLKPGGYSIRDLGFISYRGHLTHSYGRNLETAEPTCTEIGFERGTCYVCKAKLDKVIPALGHPWQVSPENGDIHSTVQYTCTRCGETKAAPLCAGEFFTDAPDQENWAHESVDWVWSNGIMNGTSDTTFDPKGITTRAMMVRVLYNMAGDQQGTSMPEGYRPGFTDVIPGAWYDKAVCWAEYYGIVNGVSATSFRPNDPVSREQLVTIIYRFASGAGLDDGQRKDLSGYTDGAKVSSWAMQLLSHVLRKIW